MEERKSTIILPERKDIIRGKKILNFYKIEKYTIEELIVMTK